MIAIFPEIRAAAARGDLEGLSILVRKYFADTEKYKPIVNIEQLVEKMGIPIEQIPMDSKGSIFAKDEKGRFRVAIGICDGLSVSEERFLIAHLLGHFLFDLQPLIAEGDLTSLGFKEIISPEKRYMNSGYGHNDSMAQSEKLSDDFAAALLLPKAMVERAYEKLGTYKKTAEFFMVNELVLRRRLEEMNISEQEPINFMDAELKQDRVEGQATIREKQRATDGKKDIGSLGLNTKLNPVNVKKAYAQHSQPEPKKPNLSGMARIRQIAKMLDRNS